MTLKYGFTVLNGKKAEIESTIVMTEVPVLLHQYCNDLDQLESQVQ